MATTKKRKREVEGGEKNIDAVEGAVKKKAAPKEKLTTLPLVIGPNAGKEGKSTLLIEVDTSSGGYGGDTGAIGRLNFDGSGEIFTVDLRGREHDAKIVPCRAMLAVSVGHEEAKIESVSSEYVQLSNSRDALAGMRQVVSGDYDDSYKFYEGDVDVNARSRNGQDDDDGAKRQENAAGTTKRDAKKKRKKGGTTAKKSRKQG